MSDENQIITFGCRTNLYESEVMRESLKNTGVTNAIIFNTCAVTSEAERQAKQAIRKARRENPGKRIIVTGCAVQVDPKKYEAMPEVDNVLGNNEKLHSHNWLKISTERAQVNDIMQLKETAMHMTESFDGRTRAFLQMQNGCNHRCTFCIIPYGRGNSRSAPLGDVVDAAKRLVDKGYKEIVLTGVDLTDYGLDLPGQPKLGDAMRRLLNLVPDLERLRLSSVDPAAIDDGVFELLATEKRLMPHLHISLQAGDDMVLKRMKRRHLRDDVLKFIESARAARADVVFGADIIAGFPTEDDVMFENTRRLVEETGLAYLHVFPYSQRSGTPAAKMPQLPKEIRKARAAILREVGKKNLNKFLQTRIGKTEKVLIENDGKGRTEHFAEVKIEGEVGSIVETKITAAQQDYLLAA